MFNTRENLDRARSFAQCHGLEVPILLAPMAGACPAALSIAVAKAGGMGACGVLMMSADAIEKWARDVRAATDGPFQLNTWIPDPAPVRDRDHEDRVRAFLGQWGPKVPATAADAAPPDFDAQCAAMLAARPAVMSSIMGVFPPDVVTRMKDARITWFATATTVAEARQAQDAGADVIVAQGMEAGGHRGAFHAADAGDALVGLFSLLPAVVDAVDVPVVATGGIADARGIAAALTLGASAVQIGTGFLRAPEAGISPVWADAIGSAAPEETVATRAFSGRLGRSLRTRYTTATARDGAPRPAPYPVQRNLTQTMRTAAANAGTLDGMQAWAGQSARLAPTTPAAETITALWKDTLDILA